MSCSLIKIQHLIQTFFNFFKKAKTDASLKFSVTPFYPLLLQRIVALKKKIKKRKKERRKTLHHLTHLRFRSAIP